MRYMLKFLARLYPAAWRQRYGAEFEALIEDREPRTSDLFDVLWGVLKASVAHRGLVWIVLPCAMAGTLIAAAISFVEPPHYVSVTRFRVISRLNNGVCQNPNDLPDELRGPTPGVCEDAATFNRFLNFLKEGYFDQDFLASEIQQRSLYPRQRTRESIDSVIAEMRKNIEVKPIGRQVGGVQDFVVSFDYPDPRVAQQVDRDLVARGPGKRWFSSIPPNTSLEVRSDLRASMPTASVWLGRLRLALVGFLGGFLSGLLLNAVLGLRRATTFAKG